MLTQHSHDPGNLQSASSGIVPGSHPKEVADDLTFPCSQDEQHFAQHDWHAGCCEAFIIQHERRVLGDRNVFGGPLW